MGEQVRKSKLGQKDTEISVLQVALKCSTLSSWCEQGDLVIYVQEICFTNCVMTCLLSEDGRS